MSNNLPNSKNDGYSSNSGNGNNNQTNPAIASVRRDTQQKVDKILNNNTK